MRNKDKIYIETGLYLWPALLAMAAVWAVGEWFDRAVSSNGIRCWGSIHS